MKKINLKILALIILFAIFGWAGESLAANYYVDAARPDDSGDGQSWATAKKTVQAGVNAAQSGDTVLLAAGVYDESVSTVRSGTSDGRIVLDGQHLATLKQLNISGHDYITIQNLTLRGVIPTYSQFIRIGNYSDYAIIQDNIIDGDNQNKVSGISFQEPAFEDVPWGNGKQPTFATITRNTIKNIQATASFNIMGDFHTITYNTSRDLRSGDHIRLFGRGHYIAHNSFLNNLLIEGFGNHPDFIQTFGNNCHGSRDHILESNYIYNCAGGLTQLSSSRIGVTYPDAISNWTFRNNVFHKVHNVSSNSISNVSWYNNIFYLNGANGVIGGFAGGPLSFHSRYFDPGTSGCNGNGGTDYAHGGKVYNNVFLDNGDATSSKGWYSFENTLTNIAADYNYVGKTINGVPYSPVDLNSTHQAVGDPGGWDVWSWWEVNGFNGGNLGYVLSSDCGENMAGCDFRISAGNILVDKGKSLSDSWTAAVDYQGLTRPQGAAWDIGAYEYTSAYVPPVGDESLLVHYDFESDFTQGTLTDLSASGNNASCQLSFYPNNDISKPLITANQCPNVAVGPDGSRAARFSGSTCFLESDYFAIPKIASLENLSAGTVSVWINYNSLSDPSFQVPFTTFRTQRILDTRTMGVLNSWALQKNYGPSTQVTLNRAGDSELALLTFPDADVTDSWNHYTFTWDAATAKAYFNGSLVQEVDKSDVPYFAVTNYIALGALKHNADRNKQDSNCVNYYSQALYYYRDHGYLEYEDPLNKNYVQPNSGFFNGKLDELRIYNRALTQAEIQQETANDITPPSAPSGLSVI